MSFPQCSCGSAAPRWSSPDTRTSVPPRCGSPDHDYTLSSTCMTSTSNTTTTPTVVFFSNQTSIRTAVFAKPQQTCAQPPKGSVCPPNGSVWSASRSAIRGEAVAPKTRHFRLLECPLFKQITPTMPSPSLSGAHIKDPHGRHHPCSRKRLTGQVSFLRRLLPPPRSSSLCFLSATS